jgi:calcium-translocating P-type ATPase
MQQTDLTFGLRQEDAEKLLKQGLGNSLSPGKRTSFLTKLLGNLNDPIIKILLAALAVNVLFLFRGQSWFETAGIAFAILAASLISTLSEYSSESAFVRLRQEAAKTTCRVRRDGLLRELPAEELVDGDVVLLEAGEGIPADGWLRRGALQCDQAALSGESREVDKTCAPLPEVSPRWDTAHPQLLFRGSNVTHGEGLMQVLRCGDRTLLGSMALSLQEEPRESPLKVRLGALARSMSRLGYTAAALVAFADLFHRLVMDNGFVPSLILAELSHFPAVVELLLHAATLALGVVIVAVPEGLPMMITVVLSHSMARMQKDQVLVRKLTGIETAGSLSLLFTDKTGTLTRGRLAVEGLMLGNGTILPPRDLPKHPQLWQAVQESCLLNTGAQWSVKDPMGGNATDRALLELVGRGPVSAIRTRYLPFDSAKKYSAAAVSNGAFPGYIKGAPELLLPRCSQWLSTQGLLPLGNGAALALAWEQQAAHGMRVVCLCAGAPEGGSLVLLGLALIRDGLRPEAAAAVRRIHGAGVQVVMVTGDSPDTAKAIAQKAGLLRGGGQILTSADLAQMTDRQVQEVLPRLRVVARALPTDKSRLVRLAQNAGYVVGMTGDGINDAPALKLADVGFAMGSGTRVAKEAGDILILDDNIASIGRAILYGRTIFRSIQRFIVFQLTMNLTAVAISILGPFLGVETPVTVIQMLWINIIMDTLAGLAYAGEPPLERYLEEPPKPREAPVLTRTMAAQVGGLALYMVGLCAVFLKLPLFRQRFGPEDGPFLTAFFALFVFSGLFSAFCARAEGKNLFRGLGKNRSFLIIMALCAGVQVLLLYVGGPLFRTQPPTARQLLEVLLLAATVVPADLLRKICFRT